MTNEELKAYEKQLKPCKHCNHRARLEQTIFGGWFVRCGNYLCDVFPITEGTFKTPEEAIEYWNNDLPMESREGGEV